MTSMKDNKKTVILITLSPTTQRTAEENLGIEYLASMIELKGINVKLIDQWLTNINIEEIYRIIEKTSNVLFIGISCYMTNIKKSIELIKYIKDKYNIPVICGGFGPTFNPQFFLDNAVDIVSIGEGEKTIQDIVDYYLYKTIDINNIKGIAYNEHNKIKFSPQSILIDDLNKIPFPKRAFMNEINKRKCTVNVVTSRGCSGRCEFCSVIQFFKKSNGICWRARSIENIIEELIILKNQNIKYVKFVDDSFIDGNRDIEWCKIFLKQLKEKNINMNFRGQIRADKVNKNILKYLRKAGFFSFSVGIENGSKSVLKRINKKVSLTDNIKALKYFKQNKYIVQMGFILFDNETTLKELKENYKFLSRFKWTVTKGVFSEMFPAEDTKFTNRLKKEKLIINEKDIEQNYKYRLKNKEIQKIYDILKKWQKLNSELYDMVIDPLSAPKALPIIELKKIYKQYKIIKDIDLKFFKYVLNNYKIINNYDQEIKEFRKKYNNKFELVQKNIKQIYIENELEYDSNTNTFLF